MNSPLNLQTQIATTKTPSVHRRPFMALKLFAALAFVTAASSIAQIATPAAAVAPIVAAASPAAFAQIAASTPLQLPIASSGDQPSSSSTAAADLPDAPQPSQVASIYTKYIPAGWGAQPLTAHDKVVIGLRDLYSPMNFAAMFITAGYEQVLNGQPNYGTDRGAFGERLGAAAIRETTQGIFTDAIFAPLLREDPRYYVEGPQYGFIHRTLYAITRPLVTRTDSGRSSINGALLFGYASSSALSYAYYPPINRNFNDTAATFGGSIGGAALGFFVSEFASDVLHKLHLSKRD